MNILSELGFNEDTINKIIEQNGKAILTDLDNNSKLVKTNYMLLKTINITCLEELFIYEIDIFLMNTELLTEKIKNTNNIEEFINKVNEDFFNIETII